MDDLDDLLGGPTSNNKEIDDLLSDGKSNNNTANNNNNAPKGAAFDFDLDDDLLGGGGGGGGINNEEKSPSPSHGASSSSAAAGSTITNRPDTRLQKDNSYTPLMSETRNRSNTIKAIPLAAKDISAALLPYAYSSGLATNELYFIRAVRAIDCVPCNMSHSSNAKLSEPSLRTRIVVAVNSTHVVIFSPSVYEATAGGAANLAANPSLRPFPVRMIPIETIFGITTQDVAIPKLFGAKAVEFHVLIHVRENADLLIVLTEDHANNNYYHNNNNGQNPNNNQSSNQAAAAASSSADSGGIKDAAAAALEQREIIRAIAAVTFAYGITLPVGSLHEGEMIEKMSSRLVGRRGDERLRQKQIEQLAFRTELLEEKQQLQSEMDAMTIAIEKLKVTELAKTAEQIQTDVHEHEKAIAQFKKNMAGLDEVKRELAEKLSVVEGRIKAEAERRAEAAKKTMASAQHDAFKRQVAEFEQMKNAHSRDMDKLANLIAFCERRLKTRGGGTKMSYAGVLEITDRLEELEEEVKFLEEQLARGAANHSRQMEVLAIAKKETVPQGREGLQRLVDEVRALQSLKERMDMEGDARVRAQPHVYESVLSAISREKPKSVRMPMVAAKEVVIAPSSTAHSAEPSSAEKQKAVSLDDDDDDDLPGPPPAAAAAPKPKPSISLDDDDDDDDDAAPPPPQPPKAVVLDDDEI